MMEHMPSWLIDLLLVHRYWLVLPLAWAEGPMVTFAVGSLAALGYYKLYLVYPLLVLADFIPDVIYYSVGRYGHGRKTFDKFTALHMHLQTIERMWHNHTLKMMFFAKWAFGLSIVLMMSAGYSKLPMRRYLLFTLPISMLQYGVFLLLGYFLGASAMAVNSSVSYIEILVAVALVVFLGVNTVLAKYARKQFEFSERQAEKEV